MVAQTKTRAKTQTLSPELSKIDTDKKSKKSQGMAYLSDFSLGGGRFMFNKDSEQRPLLYKVNLSDSRFTFEGFLNSYEDFKNISKDLLANNLAEVKVNADLSADAQPAESVVIDYNKVFPLPLPFPDNSIASCKIIYSLEYVGSESNTNTNLVAFMQELYRASCDGALIEIRANSKHFLDTLDNPATQRYISANKLRFFDQHYVENYLAQDNRVSLQSQNYGINFRFLRQDCALHAKGVELVKQQGFTNAEQASNFIEQNPHLVNYYTFYLAVVKDHNKAFDYALVNYSSVVPFVMRVYNEEHKEMYVSRAIKQMGVHEEHETRLFEYFLNIFTQKYEQVNFLNIGANIGWYSLLAAMFSKKINVTAYEPTPDTITLLEHNVILNQLESQIKICTEALSNEEGESEFFINNLNAGSNSLKKFTIEAGAGHEEYTKIKVKTTTLDKVYLEQDKSLWPHIILMDAEGHEQFILDGAKELFSKGFKPLLITEFSPSLLNLRGECSFYRELCEKFNYRMFAILRDKAYSLSQMTPDQLMTAYNAMIEQKSEAHYDLIFVPDYFTEDNTAIKD